MVEEATAAAANLRTEAAELERLITRFNISARLSEGARRAA